MTPDALPDRQPTPGILALAAFGVALAAFCFTERLEVNGGLGWDGVIYARWARDFHQEIFVDKVDTYYIQRILPSAVVHYSLRLFRIALSDANIIRAFALVNLALLTGMGYVWGRIAELLQLRRAGRWLGFAALFLNFIVLKQAFYNPVLTDIWAYAGGLCMIHAYLAGRSVVLLGLTLAGAFVWPLAVYVGILLLIFPKKMSGIPTEMAPDAFLGWRLVTAGLATVAVVVGIRAVLRAGPEMVHGLIGPEYIEPLRPVLRLSIGVAAGYLFFGLAALLRFDPAADWRSYVTLRRIATAGALIGLFLGVKQIQFLWSNQQHFMGVSDMLAMTAFTAVAKPGIFLITHGALYGPFFLLTLILWPSVCRLLHVYGLGLALTAGLGLALSLNSQSRYILNIYPMIVPLVVLATDRLGWSAGHYWFFAGLSLLFSKCWLNLNAGGPFHGRLLEFPDQLMFMTYGPWVSGEMYVVQGIVILIAGGAMCAGAIPRLRR